MDIIERERKGLLLELDFTETPVELTKEEKNEYKKGNSDNIDGIVNSDIYGFLSKRKLIDIADEDLKTLIEWKTVVNINSIKKSLNTIKNILLFLLGCSIFAAFVFLISSLS